MIVVAIDTTRYAARFAVESIVIADFVFQGTAGLVPISLFGGSRGGHDRSLSSRVIRRPLWSSTTTDKGYSTITIVDHARKIFSESWNFFRVRAFNHSFGPESPYLRYGAFPVWPDRFAIGWPETFHIAD